MRIRIALIAIVICGGVQADDGTLFDGTEAIAISLEAPLGQIDRDDSEDPQYRSGTIVWKDASGADVRMPLKVKPRGKSRRDDDACEFPPLRLNFPKDTPKGTPFSGLNKVKLVTHCGRSAKRVPNTQRASNSKCCCIACSTASRRRAFACGRSTSRTSIPSHDSKRRAHAGFLIEPEEWLAKRRDMRVAKVEKRASGSISNRCRRISSRCSSSWSATPTFR